MGSPLSPVIADITMQDLESRTCRIVCVNLFLSTFILSPVYWWRRIGVFLPRTIVNDNLKIFNSFHEKKKLQKINKEKSQSPKRYWMHHAYSAIVNSFLKTWNRACLRYSSTCLLGSYLGIFLFIHNIYILILILNIRIYLTVAFSDLFVLSPSLRFVLGESSLLHCSFFLLS